MSVGKRRERFRSEAMSQSGDPDLPVRQFRGTRQKKGRIMSS